MRKSWVAMGLLTVTLTACSQGSNGSTNTSDSPSGSSAARSSGAATPSARHSASPRPTHHHTSHPTRAALPSDCALLLTRASLARALHHGLTGRTIYIKGLAQSKIGRTGRVTCRYGVRGKSVPVEVGISGYRTAAQAAARIRITVSAEADAGARSSRTTVDGHSATVLLGRHGSLLVYGDANRTVALTLDPKVGGHSPATALKSLAAEVSANLP